MAGEVSRRKTRKVRYWNAEGQKRPGFRENLHGAKKDMQACGPLRPWYVLRPSTTIDFEEPLMPYFVYRIHEPMRLEHLATHTVYKEARQAVRELRAAEGPASVNNIRMIFAKSEAEAEKLLSTPRDERVIGED